MSETIKPCEIEGILEATEISQDQIVMCFRGTPGIGKTQGVYEYAKKHNRNVIDLIASQVLPSEVAGVPMPVQKSKKMEYFTHVRLSKLKDGDILFFDELLQAPQQTLQACLTMIQERRLPNGEDLPNIMIVAATNPLASAAQVKPEILDRFQFVEVRFDPDSWIDYMRKKKIGVDRKFTSMIQTEGDDYNVFTPRNADKWLVAFQRTFLIEDEEERNRKLDTLEKVTSCMYGDVISMALREYGTTPLKETPTEKIKNAAAEIAGLNPDDMPTNAEKLIEYLQSLPEWDEISKKLEAIEV